MSRDPGAGLCDACHHAERVASRRGSAFLLCGRSRTDGRFPKYPPLPVVRCAGFEAQSDDSPLPGGPRRS